MQPARETPTLLPMDRRPDTAAHLLLSGEPHLCALPAPAGGVGRVWDRRARYPAAFWSGLFLTVSLLLTVPFAYTFWALLTIICRLWEPQAKPGWAIAAMLGLLAAWGLLYLGVDRTALLGNRRARAALLEKSRLLLPDPLPPTRFFVEARTAKGRFRLRHDLGWLFVYADRLVFIGDAQVAVIPLAQTTGDLRRETNWLGLEGTWLNVDLRRPWGRVRLLCRDDAVRLSDTARHARRLQAALRAWQNA